MEDCLQKFEDEYDLGFESTVFYIEGLIYKNKNSKPKVKAVEPLRSKSNYTISEIEDYLCGRVSTKLVTSPYKLQMNVSD